MIFNILKLIVLVILKQIENLEMKGLKNKKVCEAIIKNYCIYFSKQLSDQIINNMKDLFFKDLEYKYKNIVYESQKEERRFTLKL